MQRPYVFLLNAGATGVPASAFPFFIHAMLRALSDSDPQARVRAELRGGLPMVHHFAEKVVAISRRERQQSHTIGHDMDLYKTLVWDMSDALRSGWASADPEYFLDVVGHRQCECLALSDLPDDIRDALDRRLRETSGYVGAFALDCGNPIQRDAFYDMLSHLAVIDGGAVLQELSVEGQPDWSLDGAEDYCPGGLVWKPHFWHWSDDAVRLAKSSMTSPRGNESVERARGKRRPSVGRRVVEEILRYAWSDSSGTSYAFDVVERDQDVLQAVLPEGKFTKYLFDRNHKDGASKAKFFIETLRFEPEDWRFLAGQFYEGLVRARPRDLKIERWSDGYGARFNALVRVRSRTGESGVVRTGWMLRPNELPSLSTAKPGKDGPDVIDPGIPPIIPPSLTGDGFWHALYEMAHAEGVAAHNQAVPTPMFLDGYEPIPEGECGFAGVVVKDARRGFARWLLKTGHGHKAYRGGAYAGCTLPSQSHDRAVAYAKAFARVLMLNGVAATFDSRLD